jgi:MATE family multidrug resistance protein
MQPDRDSASEAAQAHPFVQRPHRTLLALSVPVLFSLIAEPLTGIVDTAFVARLGAVPLAALGVATTLLSGVFWVFNFLAIGTQTEVGRSLGAGDHLGARRAAGLAITVGAVLGGALALATWPWLDAVAAAMGADGALREGAVTYLRIRLLGGPALLAMLAAFGALRGLQDMRTPLYVAVAANGVNAALDPLLIFGFGPLPSMGVAGAAWAATFSQWAGALWALLAVRRRIGLSPSLAAADVLRLFVVGRDLFARTGLLFVFVILATRTATRIGAEAGAAHQAIRQVWMLTALLLDAYAITGQSLISYFLGARQRLLARRVAATACWWGVITGCALTVLMFAGERAVVAALVPSSAVAVFGGAWMAAALAQPLNALSFVTDGIHWGTGDYRYLRNAMLVATAVAATALLLTDLNDAAALTRVWGVTAVWITIRSAAGVIRVWPGFGAAPLGRSRFD